MFEKNGFEFGGKAFQMLRIYKTVLQKDIDSGTQANPDATRGTLNL